MPGPLLQRASPVEGWGNTPMGRLGAAGLGPAGPEGCQLPSCPKRPLRLKLAKSPEQTRGQDQALARDHQLSPAIAMYQVSNGWVMGSQPGLCCDCHSSPRCGCIGRQGFWDLVKG